MLTNLQFEQYSLDILYDLVEGDFYASDRLDWECIGGQWTDSDDLVLDMSSEEVENESGLFEKYINELIKKELLK